MRSKSLQTKLNSNCLPTAQETWVQSQVESYQRLKKWYLMLPCSTLSIIRSGSRVKWGNPGKGVAPSPTPWCSSYQKGSLRVTLDYGCQLYYYHGLVSWTKIKKEGQWMMIHHPAQHSWDFSNFGGVDLCLFKLKDFTIDNKVSSVNGAK